MPLMIEENFTARLLEQLRENELDVICVALPVDLNGLCAWSVYDEDFVVLIPPEHHRSEEHTSELQSLMRISYAVFCLKKKKHKEISESRINLNSIDIQISHQWCIASKYII